MESNSSDNLNCEPSAPSKCKSADEIGDQLKPIEVGEGIEKPIDETHVENSQNCDKGLKSILKQKGQYTMRKVNVDFDLIPKRIPYDETKDFTIEIQIVDKEPMKVKSWAALFALKKAEAEAEATAIAEAEVALKKAEEKMKREAMKRAQKAKAVQHSRKLIDKSLEPRDSNANDPNSKLSSHPSTILVEHSMVQDIAELDTIQIHPKLTELREVATCLVEDILSETPVILGIQPEENLQESPTPPLSISVDHNLNLCTPEEFIEADPKNSTVTSDITPMEAIIFDNHEDSITNSDLDIQSPGYRDLTKTVPIEVVSTAIGLLGEIELITSNILQNGEKQIP